MREIPLTKGYYAIVDDEDYAIISAVKWYACVSGKGKNVYAARRTLISDGSRVIQMHRFIMNPGNGFEVDHVNGIGTDNQKSNLRICTHAENARNSRHHQKNRGTFKGVQFWAGRYRAIIRKEGKSYHLGCFGDAVSAAVAYDQAARLMFGEFARPNFPIAVAESSTVEG